MPTKLLLLLLLVQFSDAVKPMPCDKPILWVPEKFNEDKLEVSSWKKYNSGRKPFINKGGQSYKNGKGLVYELSINNDGNIHYQLNFDNKLYPGGDIYYGIYKKTDFKKVRDNMCNKITPLPSYTILDDYDGQIDTTTISYFMMELRTTRGQMSYESSSISSLLGSCMNEPLPFLLVSFLDYTNPNSRVLGRYFASEKPEITSDALCKDSKSFFKWLIFGVSCPC